MQGSIEPPPLAAAVAALAAGRDPVDAECQKLLAQLRDRCPDLVTDKPYPPGGLGPEIPVDQKRGAILYRLVARRIAGLPAQPGDDGVVVWTHEGSELAVFVDKIQVTAAEGAVAIDLAVRCDQVKDAAVRVRFAIGSDGRPAGMLASTDERPFGPAAVIDVWGEALTAFAWQVLLHSAASLADAAGRDADGAGLIPVGVRAGKDGLAVTTMARHAFDRRMAP